MIDQKEINWHNGCLAGLEFDYEGVTYRKGSNHCIFNCGDLVINSSLVHGAPSLKMLARTTGIVLNISQLDDASWPTMEIQWSTGEVTEETSNHLYNIIRET